MEREWRLIGAMRFELSDVARVILLESYRSSFRREFPDFPKCQVYGLPASDKQSA